MKADTISGQMTDAMTSEPVDLQDRVSCIFSALTGIKPRVISGLSLTRLSVRQKFHTTHALVNLIRDNDQYNRQIVKILFSLPYFPIQVLETINSVLSELR
jgi:hypothetical protein